MKLNRKKILIIVVLLVLAISIASLTLVIIKDLTYFHSPPYSPGNGDKTEVLVVYFSRTGNTEAIEEFQRRIESKGGKFIDHLYIRRGRVYYQKSGEELIREVQDLLETKIPEWLGNE